MSLEQRGLNKQEEAELERLSSFGTAENPFLSEEDFQYYRKLRRWGELGIDRIFINRKFRISPFCSPDSLPKILIEKIGGDSHVFDIDEFEKVIEEFFNNRTSDL